MNWWARASCQSLSDDLAERFFSQDEEEIEWAREHCQGCQVRAECLADAIRMEKRRPLSERFGVFGGTTPLQRYQGGRAASAGPLTGPLPATVPARVAPIPNDRVRKVVGT